MSEITCPKCGRATDTSYVHCPNCGTILTSDPGTHARAHAVAQREAAQLERRSSKAALALIWALAGIFLIAGIVISNFGERPNNPGAGFTVGGIILVAVAILASLLYSRKFSAP